MTSPFENEKRHSRLYEEVIQKSWWTILFFLICYLAFDQGVRHLNREKLKLEKKQNALLVEKEHALKIQGELKLQIESKDEYEWVEMVLMKGLGVVPEGYTKVHFVEKQ